MRELEEDRATLLEVMRAIGVQRNPVKEPAARALEVVGRLKLNGQLRGYSPLSRVLELEGLRLAVEGKRALWRSLQASGRNLSLDLEALAGPAERQMEELERHRVEAVRRAFREGA